MHQFLLRVFLVSVMILSLCAVYFVVETECRGGIAPIFREICDIAKKQTINEKGTYSVLAKTVTSQGTIGILIVYVPEGCDGPEQIMIVKVHEKEDRAIIADSAGYFFDTQEYFEVILTSFGFMASPIEQAEAIMRAKKMLADFKRFSNTDT